MRCKDCSQVRGYPYKRSHLVSLRPTMISALRSAIDVVAGRTLISNRANQSRLASTMPTLTLRGNNGV